MTRLEVFRCEPLGCRLTRAACGRRHVAARKYLAASGKKKGRETIKGNLAYLEGAATCAQCKIGAAHARREAPRVELHELVVRHPAEVPDPKPVEAPAATRASRPPGRPPMLLEHPETGERASVTAWAGRLGLSPQTIRNRLARGMPLAEVLVPKRSAA